MFFKGEEYDDSEEFYADIPARNEQCETTIHALGGRKSMFSIRGWHSNDKIEIEPLQAMYLANFIKEVLGDSLDEEILHEENCAQQACDEINKLLDGFRK